MPLACAGAATRFWLAAAVAPTDWFARARRSDPCAFLRSPSGPPWRSRPTKAFRLPAFHADRTFKACTPSNWGKRRDSGPGRGWREGATKSISSPFPKSEQDQLPSLPRARPCGPHPRHAARHEWVGALTYRAGRDRLREAGGQSGGHGFFVFSVFGGIRRQERRETNSEANERECAAVPGKERRRARAKKNRRALHLHLPFLFCLIQQFRHAPPPK